MRPLLLISRALAISAALALVSSAAFAQSGINLSWDDCGLAGAAAKSFACDTNAGQNVLYASAIVGSPMSQLNGEIGIINLQTNQPALSDWWNLSTCRPLTAINTNYNFLANFSCVDPWMGLAAGSLEYAYQFSGIPNAARIREAAGFPGTTSIDGTEEYYMFKLNIENVKTTGAGSCAGCTDGACIVFNEIQVTQPSALNDDRTFTNPINRNYVTWQAGGGSIAGGCPDATPTHSATWGSVKSLYR